MDRRHFTFAACGALALAHRAAGAQGSWTPGRPLRLVVPAAPGSVPDATARPLAEQMGAALGQQVVVHNQPGAGGIPGMEAVVRSAPDGHTIGLATQSQLVFNSHLFDRLPYDPRRDVQPVLRLASVAMVLAAHPSLPARTFAEWLPQARAQRPHLQIAVPPLGTPPHVLALLLQQVANVRLDAVPFRGSAEAVSACVSGEPKLVLEAPPVVAPQVEGGRLRALAVTGAAREPLLPDTPTVGELLGTRMPGETWFGLVVPAGTPPEIVDRLHRAASSALRQDALRAAYARFGWRLIPDSSPAEFTAALDDEGPRWAAILRSAGLKLS